MFISRIIILFTIAMANCAAEEMQSMEEFMIDFNNKHFCNNNEYIDCMKITRDICASSFKKAFRLCASQKDIDSPAPSPVCITNNYIKFANISKSTVSSCDDITIKIKETVLPKNVPNKANKIESHEL